MSGLSNTAWTLTGNSGTNPGTHFIGTTDGADVVFKNSNLEAGRLANFNTSFGKSSLVSNTGTKNTASGYGSLFPNTHRPEWR